jgi:hypothetical protein
MSANNWLVADAVAFCAKQKEVCSEKRFRQAAPCRSRLFFESDRGYGIGRTGSDLTAVRAGSPVCTSSRRCNGGNQQA